ncbi:MAG TPA: DUF1236 domain-containing protein [Pseudolabrys sp.]|nr:DUF1236 domain-containing protein [Pseudolabrys sp.]
MSKQVLSATALALLLSVSAFSIDAAIAQTSDTPSATKKSLDDKHLTPIRPIRRVGEDSWPSAKNQPSVRETTGQAAKEEKKDTAQNDAKPDTQTTSKPDAGNSSLGNQSPPPDKPQDTAKQNAQPKQDTAKRDNKQDSANGQNGDQKTADQNSGDRKNDKNFASIRLGTDSSGRVAINDSQEKQLTSVMRKHRVETVDVKVSVGSVAPANARLIAVSSDFIDVFPQFRGYSYFSTREDIVVVEPSTRKVVALIPMKTTATASRSSEERTTATTETRPSNRTRTVVKERDVTVGSGIPSREEILAAPVARGAPAGTTVTRTYRSYQYVPDDDDDVVVIERRRPRIFPFW